MNQKIILSILGVFVIFIFGYFYFSQNKNFTDDKPQSVYEVNPQDYYDKLADECESKESESCCLASVEAMKNGGYTLVPQEGCPSGYQPNIMRCIDSYRWCQPTADSNGSETKNNNFSDNVLSELQRLDIQVTGSAKQFELTFPKTLSDANWNMKQIICQEGGYDLTPYAGKTLSFTYYPTNEVWNNSEPLNVWVVGNGDKTVCVYKTVRENSQVAPGIFSIKQNSNIYRK